MLIQKLRLRRGWSQEQLAELSGLSVRTVQRLERGQPASMESLKALGAAFEIDFSHLKEREMNTATSPTNQASAPMRPSRWRRCENWGGSIFTSRNMRSPSPSSRSSISSHTLAILGALGRPGLGIGVLFHGLRVCDKVPFLSGEWERRQVEKYLGRKL
jgi:transcriptional regulator with XRE-family HTH domain